MYIDRPPLGTVPIDSNAKEYNCLVKRAYGPFQVLRSTAHTLTVDENGISNNDPIDKATPVVAKLEYPARLEPSKTFLKDIETLFERYCDQETGNTTPPLKYCNTESGITTPLLKDCNTETELLFSLENDRKNITSIFSA